MVWHHLLIQLVSARDMVRLAQCICTMSALSRMHCHAFVHVCMCEYAVSVCFDLNYRRVPLCMSSSHGFGCMSVAFSRFCSAILLASALWLFIYL